MREDTFLAGFIYKFVRKEIICTFDELIYITDPQDIIYRKLKNLFNQKKVTVNDSVRQLTEREKNVLKLLVKGLSNKQVADQLSISPYTVITHRKNLIEKTGIRPLAGLAVYGMINNIMEMEEIRIP